MLKRWNKYLIILAGATAFYGIYDGYLSFYLLLLTIFFPFFSFFISLYSMLKVSVSMQFMPTTVKKGEPVNAVLRIDTNSRLPVPMITIKYFEYNKTFSTDKEKSSLILCDCMASDVTVHLDTSHIGCIYFAVQKIRVYDYTGLFCIPVKPPEARATFILPELTPPDPMPVLPMDKVGGKGLRPKPGGGFAEDYDLREYRIGDPLNSIHWKLSSKLDELIVREPLISEKGRLFICIDLFGAPEDMDSTFGQLFYIAYILIKRMIEFNICWYGPNGQLKMVEIAERDDFLKFVVAAFAEPIPKEGKSIDASACRKADWYYIIRPAGRRNADAAKTLEPQEENTEGRRQA